MATHPTQYAHPEALVETDRLEKHLKDEDVRIVESNEDVLLYGTGHIPGAVHIDWRADLQDPVIRDYILPEKFAELCSRNGITRETTRTRSNMREDPTHAVLRRRHISGAKNLRWIAATNDDATFKPASELAKIYLDQCDVKPSTETVVYCRIG